MEHYTDSFISLLEAVESQGGELLPETCLPDEYTIKVNKPQGGVKLQKVHTTGCGKAVRLVITYDPSAPVTVPAVATRDNPDPDDKLHRGDHGAGKVVVCAEDDGVQFWPRFKGAV